MDKEEIDKEVSPEDRPHEDDSNTLGPGGRAGVMFDL